MCAHHKKHASIKWKNVEEILSRDSNLPDYQ